MENIQAARSEPEATAAVESAPGAPQSVLTLLRTPLLEAIEKPIPGPEPCGKDVSYDDDFLRIKGEIDKMESVTVKIDQEKALEDARQLKSLTAKQLREQDSQRAKGQGTETKSITSTPAGADFSLIVEKASSILIQKSKDLRVASYLCLALWRRDGFQGLGQGLAAVLILVRSFWEGMFPGKARIIGRKNTLDFLTQRLSDNLRDVGVRTEDQKHLEIIQAVAEELKTELNTRMPDGPPSFAGVSSALEQCLRRVPKQQLPTMPGPAAAQQAGIQGAAAPAGGAVEAMHLRSQQDAVDLIKRISSFLRGTDAKTPLPYRLVRCMRWDSIQGEPPNENGKTKMEPPAQQRRAYLTGLHESGQWEKLLEESESSFLQSPFHFWLDQQRLTVSAMDALQGFERARKGILLELAMLIRRIPRLPNLLFADGTQFASPATHEWIQDVVLPELGLAESKSGVVRTSDDDRELAEKFDEAKRILAAGDLAGALSLLNNASSKDASSKSGFRRRLHMAGLCMRANQSGLARPILEELDQEIEKSSLDQWEPALALEVWRDLHRCYESLTSGPQGVAKQSFRENADRVFSKICRVDVAQALALTGVLPAGRRTAEVLRKKSADTAERKKESASGAEGSADQSGEKGENGLAPQETKQ
jgi:type VI secretion system protein VasJ